VRVNNAISAVMSMRCMYNIRRALKQNDQAEILRWHALYEEWQVRPEETPTSPWARQCVDWNLTFLR